MSLTLYSRSGCHLCEDMAAALDELQKELGFQLERIDIDSDPALIEVYGTLVPVLKDGDTEICHYFLDPQALRDHLVI
ncbi:MAG: glutaredoxin family protein [Gammaproteobacteria bacterium]|nr:glutaredoxin family protein [Gammaproteobacteria bacterium]